MKLKRGKLETNIVVGSMSNNNMAISIFAKPPFLNIHPNRPYVFDGRPITRGHLMRVSSLIRGIQMAESLGCKLNPTEGYEDDICIYVKPHVAIGNDFHFEKNSYMDIIDGWDLVHLMKMHPEVPVLAISKWDIENLSRELKNKIIFLPQRHFNPKRLLRTKDAVVNVGIVGTVQGLPFLPNELESGLIERGMKFVEYHNFEDKDKLVEFHQNLFVQIVWRPYRRKMGNALKLYNAASVGVPTIALKEECFKEMDGNYIPVTTLQEFFIELDKFRNDPSLYSDFSNKIISKAEEYHVENIVKLYQELT